MNVLLLPLCLLLFLFCSKSSGEKCFEENDEDKAIVNNKSFSDEQIFDKDPEYLQVISLKKYRPFKKDSIDHVYNPLINSQKEGKYADFKKKFDSQFICSDVQFVGKYQYCLGRNLLGYWLLKIDSDKAAAYFLGLSLGRYYVNRTQTKPIINNGFLELEGSFLKAVEVGGLPGHTGFSATQDGKLFRIKLDDLIEDSDSDGYNDIFEKSFGLNPNNRDTDGDGKTDFEDLNPMFASESNKFIQLYEMLLPDFGDNLKSMNYSFLVFESECDYFHKINPKYRVLFTRTDGKVHTPFLRSHDLTIYGISKMRRSKEDKNVFYISQSDNSGKRDFAAEYKNGKWILKIIGGYDI